MNLSILSRILLLVAGTLVLALVAMMLVTFRGPPPHARPVTSIEAAALLRTGIPPSGGWQITRYRSDRAPDRSPLQQSDLQGANRIARALGLAHGTVLLLRESRPIRPGIGNVPDDADLRGDFVLARRMGDSWSIVQARPAAGGRWYAITLSLMTGIFLLLLAPAYWVARRITLPIRLLAEGAARERPERTDPLPIAGPPEVRMVGTAFNQMRARLADHLTERTAMLVAIAHDLRTPMTRLSFRLEHLPEPMRTKAQSDVQEMRVMVTDLLDFMRGQTGGAPRPRIDLATIVQTLADDMADMGHAVTQGVTQRAVLRGDAIALRRCICNLVDNGIRYGGGARISLANDDGRCRVLVEDDGPGVPPATIERLCEPFYRGEASRNRETGGVGLGLSIGRAIAEAHDGTLHLENREEGGLRAILTLPLE